MKSDKTILQGIPDKKKFIDFLQQHMTAERIRRFEEVLSYRTRHITIAAEDTYQERNASALIRTADCFGIQDVHIIENYNQYKISTSIAGGADKWVDVCQYTGEGNNTEKCIKYLRENGYRIVASTPYDKSIEVEALDIKDKTAIFLGAEKRGISETILDHADAFIRIPMVGFTESFNLSVAGALILYSLTNRIKNMDVDWKLHDEEKDDLRIKWAMASIHRSDDLLHKYIAEYSRKSLKR